MEPKAITGLNKLLWELQALPALCGDHGMEVTDYGSPDPITGNFKGAEVQIGEHIYLGTVFFTDAATPTLYSNEAILQVATPGSNPVLLDNGIAVPRLEAQIPTPLLDFYGAVMSLSDSSRPTPCSDYICSLDEVKRVQLLLRLFTDRTERKYMQEMRDLLQESHNDWNYAMYVTLFKAMGGSKFKHTYIRLAKAVPYAAVAHEKATPHAVEAMLLGASGLLYQQREDEYVIVLKRDFDYLCRKYDIMPMEPSVWEAGPTASNMPYGFPVLRIAQLAGFLSSREFIFDAVRNCRTPGDIHALFCAEAPEYWSEKFNTTRLGNSTRRMGTEHMDRLGINFVVPLQFAYAQATGDEHLVQSAQDLVDAIAAESNRITKLWRGRGVRIANACDSQAILELNNEYCKDKNCTTCPVGRQLIKKQIQSWIYCQV